MATYPVGAIAALLLTAAAPLPKPPVAMPRATVDIIQGVKVADPYRWLENPADPKVKAWVAGQNAASEANYNSLPIYRPLHDWLLSVKNRRRRSIADCASKAGGCSS